jgi:hypothetical protein
MDTKYEDGLHLQVSPEPECFAPFAGLPHFVHRFLPLLLRLFFHLRLQELPDTLPAATTLLF